MTKFDKWVRDMYLKFAKECKKGKCEVTYLSDDTITLCYDKKNNKVGIAKRHPEDKPDRELGVAIAYARCKGYEIPKPTVYKKLSEMENGEMFYDKYGDIYRYIGKNENIYVCYWEHKYYREMLFDIECEMVD